MYSKEVHCVIATPGYYFRERQGSICGPPHASKHILFQWHTLLPTTASARFSSYGSRNPFRSSGAGFWHLRLTSLFPTSSLLRLRTSPTMRLRARCSILVAPLRSRSVAHLAPPLLA